MTRAFTDEFIEEIAEELDGNYCEIDEAIRHASLIQDFIQYDELKESDMTEEDTDALWLIVQRCYDCGVLEHGLAEDDNDFGLYCEECWENKNAE
jgi:hypothetical protein